MLSYLLCLQEVNFGMLDCSDGNILNGLETLLAHIMLPALRSQQVHRHPFWILLARNNFFIQRFIFLVISRCKLLKVACVVPRKQTQLCSFQTHRLGEKHRYYLINLLLFYWSVQTVNTECGFLIKVQVCQMVSSHLFLWCTQEHRPESDQRQQVR